jgi:hypothetical protein
MRGKAFLCLMAMAPVISMLGCSEGTSGSMYGKRMSCSGESLEGAALVKAGSRNSLEPTPRILKCHAPQFILSRQR